ncbi:MAG: hypothetical protein ABEJ92_00140, partial [Halobacteriales archaeon]
MTESGAPGVRRAVGRRAVLRALGSGAIAGLAGCSLPGAGGDETPGEVVIPPLSEFRGSGSLVAGRPEPG